jgi:hypothetical protein
MDYAKKSYKELKDLCREHGLSATGTKIVLVDRLKEYYEQLEIEKNKFRVYIKTLSGSCYTIYVEPSDTILQLKQKIQDKNNCPPEKQKLHYICNNRSSFGNTIYSNDLEDEKTLSDCGINNGSFFDLQIRF